MIEQRSENVLLDELKIHASKKGKKTEYGSVAFFNKTTKRSAKETEIIFGDYNADQIETIMEIERYIKNINFFLVDGSLCKTNPFFCRAFIPKNYSQIGYIWASTLFKKTGNPDFITIVLPDWKETKVISDVKTGITLILGSDYAGELKMANLRLAMFKTKENNGLGFHAGSKKINGKGVLLFGLSATGKTTLTCHNHFSEEIEILQDDIVLMQRDGKCLGTENNFYVKTIGLDETESIIYEAAKSENAILENVYMNGEKVDFLNGSVTRNGRAVIARNEMKHTTKSIDLERVDMIFFITRRETVVPSAAKLTREQAAAFFMLGESVGSSASDYEPGKSIRVVGTNPFIIGKEDLEGNRFYDLIKNIDCYLLNTGGVGKGGNSFAKITVKDSAIIIREITKKRVKWKKDHEWDYFVLDHCNEIDISKFDPELHYSKEKFMELTNELKKERKEWISKFPDLYPQIKNSI